MNVESNKATFRPAQQHMRKPHKQMARTPKVVSAGGAENALGFENQILMAARRREMIKQVLSNATEPLTLQEIYEVPKVKELCKDRYNVNDDLKAMRGKEISKVPSHKPSARYAYTLFKEGEQTVQIPEVVVKQVKSRKKQHDIDYKATNIERRASRLNKEQDIEASLDTLRIFLNEQELKAFAKGAIITFPEHKEKFLELLNS